MNLNFGPCIRAKEYTRLSRNFRPRERERERGGA